ncbi:hypothetical protein GCM10010517_19570 [Streptosporangium fragile]|uniref:Uncharacterized protein n=1 Tax=Streptosporangium fragile TaxID=46186 RepID=A0ABN3VTL9_9ACTN
MRGPWDGVHGDGAGQDPAGVGMLVRPDVDGLVRPLAYGEDPPPGYRCAPGRSRTAKTTAGNRGMPGLPVHGRRQDRPTGSVTGQAAFAEGVQTLKRNSTTSPSRIT